MGTGPRSPRPTVVSRTSTAVLKGTGRRGPDRAASHPQAPAGGRLQNLASPTASAAFSAIPRSLGLSASTAAARPSRQRARNGVAFAGPRVIDSADPCSAASRHPIATAMEPRAAQLAGVPPPPHPSGSGRSGSGRSSSGQQAGSRRSWLESVSSQAGCCPCCSDRTARHPPRIQLASVSQQGSDDSPGRPSARATSPALENNGSASAMSGSRRSNSPRGCRNVSAGRWR